MFPVSWILVDKSWTRVLTRVGDKIFKNGKINHTSGGLILLINNHFSHSIWTYWPKMACKTLVNWIDDIIKPKTPWATLVLSVNCFIGNKQRIKTLLICIWSLQARYLFCLIKGYWCESFGHLFVSQDFEASILQPETLFVSLFAIKVPSIRMNNHILHDWEVIPKKWNGTIYVQSNEKLHRMLVVGSLSGDLHRHIWCQLLPVLRRFIHEFIIDWPLVGTRGALTFEMIICCCTFMPILDRCSVKIKSIVDVHFGASGYFTDDTDNLMVLVTNSHRVWIATVIEEWHCREDGSPDWNDVEFGDIIIL